ncbi:uncharacterized protein LOC144798592 isoform X2 [Lissotriton helveticus]
MSLGLCSVAEWWCCATDSSRAEWGTMSDQDVEKDTGAFNWEYEDYEETPPPSDVGSAGLVKGQEILYAGCEITEEENGGAGEVRPRAERGEDEKDGRSESGGEPGGQRPCAPPCHTPEVSRSRYNLFCELHSGEVSPRTSDLKAPTDGTW